MIVVYDAGRQGRKVQALVWLLPAAGLFLLWVGFLEPAVLPPPEVEPPWQRLVPKALASAAALLFTAGPLLFARLYVRRAWVDDGGRVHVLHVRPLGRRVVQPGDVEASRYVDGDPGVEAPWFSVRLRGRRLPLILDPQGDVPDPAAAERAFGLEPGSLPRPGAEALPAAADPTIDHP